MASTEGNVTTSENKRMAGLGAIARFDLFFLPLLLLTKDAQHHRGRRVEDIVILHILNLEFCVYLSQIWNNNKA